MGEAARSNGDKPETLKQLVKHVYDTRWATQAGGEKQFKNAMDVINIIGPNSLIKNVGKFDIDKASAQLAKTGITNSTVNRKLAALSTCMTEARDMEIIIGKPVIKKLSFAEVEQRRFTPEYEAKAITYFQRVGHHEMVDFVIVSLDTGMREGETLAARFSDVHNGKVTVWGQNSDGKKSKSRKSRTVPLTKRALEVIERRRTATNEDLIFHDLKKWSAIYWWGNFREAVGMTGQKDFKIHSLRHEFCSRLADRRVDAATIMKLAGHSSLTVTQRYIHVSGLALDEAISELDCGAINIPAMQAFSEVHVD
jgi:integrase